MTLPVALPYGLRDVKITPYTDALGTILGNTSYDLPNSQTFSFSDAEEFQELRGDDKLVTTHGQGADVEWSLEAGGVSLQIWKIFTGGSLAETGLAPNRRVKLTKKSSDTRPYFLVEGQAISDSGGDLHAKVFRCRADSNIEGAFNDGEFFITQASGKGLPLLDDSNDLLYEFSQNEQRTAISLTPESLPIPAPQNIVPGALTSTTVALTWDAVSGATGYVVEQAVSPYSTWSAVGAGAGGEPVAASTIVTGLTSSTAYKFRAKAVTASGTSPASVESGVITTTA